MCVCVCASTFLCECFGAGLFRSTVVFDPVLKCEAPLALSPSPSVDVTATVKLSSFPSSF
jgi:hypothetical protein